jgi:hypothetical protein
MRRILGRREAATCQIVGRYQDGRIVPFRENLQEISRKITIGWSVPSGLLSRLRLGISQASKS